MFDPARFSLFLAASAVLILTPGPAVLYIVARSLAQGRRAGLISVAGIGAGTLGHVVGAAVGLSALLASSATAYATLRYAGAAYLGWLGLRKLLTRPALPAAAVAGSGPAPSATFRQAVLVGILNPKTALFFLAFLPQFADPARGSVTLQLLALGGTFVVLAILSDGAYALLAGTFGGWLKRHPLFTAGERWVSGAVYCGLGAAAVMAGD